MRKAPVAYQLYSARELASQDLLSVLKALRKMGYDGVEFAGFYGHTADKIRDMLAETGLKAISSHVAINLIEEDMQGVIDYHKAISCPYIAVPYLPAERRAGKPGFAGALRTIWTFGCLCRENGIQLLYHNHDFEFAPLQDSNKSMMDVLLEESDPALIHLIPDVAWIHFAGCDPVTFLKENADRVKVVHFKDYVKKADARPKFASLGQGVVPLRECFAVCREQEIPYVMYEQDDNWTMGDPFLATEESLRCFTELHQS